MDRKELVAKAVWPATVLAVTLVAGNVVQKFSQDAVTVSQNALKASENAVAASNNAVAVANIAKGVVDAVTQTTQSAPQLAGDAGHAAGEGIVRGVANGAVQVTASVALAPITVPAQAAAGLLSKPDRENVERIVNPAKWKIF